MTEHVRFEKDPVTGRLRPVREEGDDPRIETIEAKPKPPTADDPRSAQDQSFPPHAVG